LFSHGFISCFGSNADGRLGLNWPVSSNVVGAAAVKALGYISFSDTIPAVQLSMYRHVCAIFVNRRMRCWGNNDAQQLGRGVSNVDDVGADSLGMSAAVYVSFIASLNTIFVTAIATGRYGKINPTFTPYESSISFSIYIFMSISLTLSLAHSFSRTLLPLSSS
jgi:hypothetical protein